MYNTSCVLQGVRERVNMVFLFQNSQYPLLTQSLHIPSLKKKKKSLGFITTAGCLMFLADSRSMGSEYS